MPLLASSHAALETGSQIGATNFVEGGDGLLLGRVCHFHFVLRGRVAYLCGTDLRVRIFWEVWLAKLTMLVPHGSGASRQSVVEIPESRCLGYGA